MLGDVVRTGKDSFRTGRRLRAALLTSSALTLAWALPATPARAQDATWTASPYNSLYNFGPNWDSGGTPSGTAYFGPSNATSLYTDTPLAVGGWTLNADASNYSIYIQSGLTFTGAGIVVNGGDMRIVNAYGSILTFANASTSGPAYILSNDGGLVAFTGTSTAGTSTLDVIGGLSFADDSTAASAVINNTGTTAFFDRSTAGSASINNNGILQFNNLSTAGTATITNLQSLYFHNSSSADHAAITNTGTATFDGTSTAGNAIITNSSALIFAGSATGGSASIVNNNGGTIFFYGNSTGGGVAITNNTGGYVDFSNSTGPAGDGKLAAGSIAGAGAYYLDSKQLWVGSNNQSTEVSGVISGTGGSLVKTGSGTLILSGLNTYTGGTSVSSGTLQIGTLSSVGAVKNTIDTGPSGTLNLVNADMSGLGSIINSGTTNFFNRADGGGMAIVSNAGGTVDFSGTTGAAGDGNIHAGSIAGGGNYVLGTNHLIVGSNNADTEMSGVISGTGSLEKVGYAWLTLSGINTYSGGTTVTNGILALGSSTSAGSIQGTVTVNYPGNLNVVNSNADTISSISNSGNVAFFNNSSAGHTTISNAAYLYFNDNSNAGNADVTNGGRTWFQGTSSGGNATITNNNNNNFLYFTVNSTGGHATINNNSFLQFQDNSSAGSATITNNYYTYFNDSSSAGSATIINNSLMIFNNHSNAGSAAIVNNSFLDFSSSTGAAGDHKLTAGSIAGGGFYSLGANELTVGSNNQSTEVSGNIGGSGGSLVKTGTGTLILSGNNSYTGGTTINGGTLQIGNGGTTGSLAGNIIDNGTFVFNRSDTITFAGAISGSGFLRQVGSNTTILTGDGSGFTGITTIAAGTLQIGDGGTTGSLAGNVVNDGVLAINRSDAVTLPGDISGSGSVQQIGSGTAILIGNNSYTGGTTITAGTLQIGSGGTTGAIVGDVVNDGVLAFNRSNTLTLAINISGSGSVQQIGSGTTILTGTNTYSGNTLVSSGRLQFGDGSAGGSNNLGGSIDVTGGTLAIATPATLNVAQTVTFGNNTTLSIAAGTNSPALSADSISIGSGVTFDISGIGNASQLDKVLIDTQSGISGDFASVTVGGFSGTVDYLTVSTRKSTDGLQYLASYGLSWTAGNSLAHGTFTLTNATDTFTLGVALTDQAANAATGWDGKSLTKAGDGTLILTGQNTYSGGTTISGGTLQIGNSGLTGSVLGTVNVGAGGTFEIVNADMTGITGIANSGTANFRNANSAGSINISNSGTLRFYDTSTAGTASITNATASNIYFFDNASAGSATIANNGGGLIFNNSSTAGSANIANNDWSAVLFNDTSSAGSATISNASRSSLSFLNSSTAGSATITNNGDMSFSNASTAGSATINNTSDYMHAQYAYLNFYDSSTAGSAIINNAISSTINFHDTSTAGSATITNASPGFLNFLNSSTAGNAIITNSGSINFRDSSSAGSATIDNLSGIAFFDSASAGSAHITGGGIGFLNTSTAGNATIINSSGGLSFVNSSTAGNATIVNYLYQSVGFHDSSTAGNATITNNGSMQFSNQATGGHASITNAYVLLFNDTSTAGDATIVNNNSTSFRNTSTAGSATINNNRWLTFTNQATAGSAAITNSSNVLFSDTTNAGNAQLINSTSGAVFDLSSTSGTNGDHKVTAGSLAGGGTFSLGGNALTVGSNDLSTNVTGVIADGGSAGGTGASLVKVGSGRLTLSGINTYTGATTIDGGALAVNGDITASSGVTVNAGGMLGGTGIVGNTTIASGGALAPGNSIGTLTVSGNLTFTAGSFYTVEASPTAADRTNVSGTATLTGAMVQAVAIPGRFRSQTYTILTATGGLSGTFAGITGSTFAPGARNPHLIYDLDNVYLVLDPGTIMLPAGASGNQTGVAAGINKAVGAGATPPVGFDVLLNMTDAQLAQALNQVSGQPGAASTQAAFNAMQQFVNTLDPLGGGTDGERGMGGGAADGSTLGYAATAQGDARVREAFAAVTPRDASGDVIDRRWGVWASGYGGASTLSGNAAAGSSSTTSRIYGTVVGADYRVSPDTLVGFALGGAGFNFSVADALGGGRADVFQAGLYARHNFGPAYLSAALAYGWQDVTTDRTVTVSGTDRLTANFKASTFAGRLETGWRFAPIPASSFGVTPYAAVQATTFHLPGYGETALVGSNQFALSYAAQETTNVRTELGARTDQRFLVENGVLTLRGRLAWAHDSNTNRFVNAAFQTLPGAAFTVSGARPAADSALVGGRAEMKWRNGLSLAGTVEGEFSRSTQTYTGKGTVRYEW